MSALLKVNALFERRVQRTRYNLKKKANGRLRLSVFRSGKHIYAQIIDDKKGITVVSASSLDKSLREKSKSGSTIDAAKQVGLLLAEKAVQAGVSQVVFDKGGYAYHGRVKALADTVREKLSF